MKLSQIAAIIATLVLSLVVVMWLASTVPSMVFEDSQASSKEGSGKETEPTPAEDGVESSNPFDLTTEGPQPKAVLVEELYEFGEMALGDTGTHSFIIKNEGEVALKLAKGPTQCKCTLSEIAQESIPPGGEASIELQYEPKSTGSFGQGATIWTNDPKNSELRIRVEGLMVPGFQVTPTDGWSLGAIPSQKPVELLGGLASATDDAFDITSIETSSDAVKLETVPLTDADKVEMHAKSGYRLVGSYQPSEEAGEVQETITIHTTLEKHSTITFQVTGNRSGPIAIIGPGWSAGNRLLNLGRIKTGEGHSQRLTFMVEPTEEEIEFTEIEVNPSFVQATVKAEKNAPDAARHRFTFVVEVPKDSPKGIWNSAMPGQIVLKSTHPKLQEIIISLQMMIQ